MSKKLKWQEDFISDVWHMSNKDLLNATLILAQGDDYDGCFTGRGEWKFNFLRAELDKRLGDWLTK